MSNKKNKTGSTLIEVLVAIVVVGLVLTGIMLSITYSVKNSAEARYREVASQLAQDGMEVVKLRREIDPWSTFFGYASTSSRRYICSDTTILTTTTTCSFQNGNKQYTRYVVLTRTAATVSDPATVQAKVTVEWNSDSNQLQNVEIFQEFRERVI